MLAWRRLADVAIALLLYYFVGTLALAGYLWSRQRLLKLTLTGVRLRAGRLLWPVMGNLARSLVAAIGGWFAIRWGGGLAEVFATQGAALLVYGLVIAVAIAGGAWFGRVGWPTNTTAILRRIPVG